MSSSGFSHVRRAQGHKGSCFFGRLPSPQQPHSHVCPLCNSQCEQLTPAVAGRILHAGRLCGRRGGARPGQSLWIPAVPDASAARGVAFPAVCCTVSQWFPLSTLEMHSATTQYTVHHFYGPPTYRRRPNEQQIILFACLCPAQEPKGRYRISMRERKVYDTTESRKYCCNDCHVAADFFASQLSPTAVFMRSMQYATLLIWPTSLSANVATVGCCSGFSRMECFDRREVDVWPMFFTELVTDLCGLRTEDDIEQVLPSQRRHAPHHWLQGNDPRR
jgi:hypothetical protein